MIRNMAAERLAIDYGTFVKAKTNYELDTNVDKEDSRQNPLNIIEDCKKSISEEKFPNLYGDL